jgi:protoporphyrinogen oxidase
VERKTVLIIGAGPAGLTAAYELLKGTDFRPVVLEASDQIGGISRTVVYRGNRIDIGGHRFFSKSDRVMRWWLDMMPLQGAPARDDLALARPVPLSTDPGAPDPEQADLVMLNRGRLSRIYYLRRFFDYPVTLNGETIRNLGLLRMARIGLSYFRAWLFPIRQERSLEDFMINRFGRELYGTFFKDYTQKVWGVPPAQIKPEWGAQRIKGLSVVRVLVHAIRKLFRRGDASIGQKGTETSLIERFLYPKFGPGQLWEEVARRVVDMGGEIRMGQAVVGMTGGAGRIESVEVVDRETGTRSTMKADHYISSMPVKDLVRGLSDAPPDVREVAEGLVYRDFMMVGLLLKRLTIRNTSGISTVGDIVPDNWIYVQERDVKVGRLQIYNNWSPYMVGDPTRVWVGMEYFCDEGDELWSLEDGAMTTFAAEELERLGVAAPQDILDSVVVRMPKTYPAYFGSYDRFEVVRRHVDAYQNLFLVGRNGMHKYNNMDHSMLTAMAAVANIAQGVVTKDALWAVNTEDDYHEEVK